MPRGILLATTRDTRVYADLGITWTPSLVSAAYLAHLRSQGEDVDWRPWPVGQLIVVPIELTGIPIHGQPLRYPPDFLAYLAVNAEWERELIAAGVGPIGPIPQARASISAAPIPPPRPSVVPDPPRRTFPRRIITPMPPAALPPLNPFPATRGPAAMLLLEVEAEAREALAQQEAKTAARNARRVAREGLTVTERIAGPRQVEFIRRRLAGIEGLMTFTAGGFKIYFERTTAQPTRAHVMWIERLPGRFAPWEFVPRLTDVLHVQGFTEMTWFPAAGDDYLEHRIRLFEPASIQINVELARRAAAAGTAGAAKAAESSRVLRYRVTGLSMPGGRDRLMEALTALPHDANNLQDVLRQRGGNRIVRNIATAIAVEAIELNLERVARVTRENFPRLLQAARNRAASGAATVAGGAGRIGSTLVRNWSLPFLAVDIVELIPAIRTIQEDLSLRGVTGARFRTETDPRYPLLLPPPNSRPTLAGVVAEWSAYFAVPVPTTLAGQLELLDNANTMALRYPDNQRTYDILDLNTQMIEEIYAEGTRLRTKPPEVELILVDVPGGFAFREVSNRPPRELNTFAGATPGAPWGMLGQHVLDRVLADLRSREESPSAADSPPAADEHLAAGIGVSTVAISGKYRARATSFGGGQWGCFWMDSLLTQSTSSSKCKTLAKRINGMLRQFQRLPMISSTGMTQALSDFIAETLLQPSEVDPPIPWD